jgi:hypothetical protein
LAINAKLDKSIHGILVSEEEEENGSLHAFILDADTGSTKTVLIEEVSEPKYSTTPNSPIPSTEAKLLHISLNAVKGTPVELSFSLLLEINGHRAVALVDSGSSCSFMTHQMALKTNQQLVDTNPMKVSVANGGSLLSNKLVSSNYFIQGEHFSSNFRLLPLKSYDVILGAD